MKNKISSHSLIQVDEEEEEENVVSSQTMEDGVEEERKEGEEGDVATKMNEWMNERRIRFHLIPWYRLMRRRKRRM